MSTVHCGITKPPKGKKIGSMLECAKKKQIRLYGLYKADPKIIQSIQKPKKSTMNDTQRGKLYDKIIKLKAKIKKLMTESKNKKTTDENKKKIKEIEKELITITDKLKSYEKTKTKSK